MSLRKRVTAAVFFLALLLCVLVWRTANFGSKADHSASAQSTARNPAAPVPSSSSQTLFHDGISSGGKHRYSDLSFMERNALLRQIEKLSPAEVFKIWREAGESEHDQLKQGDVATKLATVLRNAKSDPATIGQLRVFISNPANSSHDRSQLIGVLSAAGTSETVDVLLDTAKSLTDAQLRVDAIGAVGRIGDHGSGVDVAPNLERTWTESTDQNLLIAVAEAMAKTGAPTSIEKLLESSLNDEAPEGSRKIAAAAALADVYKNSAVPAVASFLAMHTSSNNATKLAGDILVNIGDQSAAAALVGWLEVAGDDAADLANAWVLKTRTPAFLQAWADISTHAATFRSEKVRLAIQAGMAQYRAGHRSEP